MKPKWDFGLLLPIVTIGLISLLSLLSIDRQLATNQLIFWLIGAIIFITISLIDFEAITKFSLLFYILVIIALIAVEIIAEPVRGSSRWIDLGIFRMQPSELAKVSLILTLTMFYKAKKSFNLRDLGISFGVVLPPIFLVFIQPDIGNALALSAIWFGMTLAGGLKISQLFSMILIGALIALTSFNFLADYQKERIYSYLNPTKDPLGTGYNIIQSKVAIGSGLFFGKGLGHGSQSQLNFLPEAESDFIFATIAEQLGFFGAGFLLLLYLLLIAKILNYAKGLDRRGQLVLSGIASFFLVQIMVNVGMNLGILPITGITLPLVSYGGSSLVSTLMLLGIALSLKRYNPSF